MRSYDGCPSVAGLSAADAGFAVEASCTRQPVRDGLIVAVFRHYASRAAESKPLLHAHAEASIRARRPDGTRGNLSADSMQAHMVAAGTLYTLLFTFGMPSASAIRATAAPPPIGGQDMAARTASASSAATAARDRWKDGTSGSRMRQRHRAGHRAGPGRLHDTGDGCLPCTRPAGHNDHDRLLRPGAAHRLRKDDPAEDVSVLCLGQRGRHVARSRHCPRPARRGNAGSDARKDAGQGVAARQVQSAESPGQ